MTADTSKRVTSGGRTRYERVAAVYDALARLYSCGAIARIRAAHAAEVRPGERILYAGAGTGEDALCAARRGAHVTLVDRAAPMLAHARRRFAGAGCSAHFVAGDVFAPRPELAPAGFDRVVAAFFLNTLVRSDVTPSLAALCRLLRPGGALTIVDFGTPSGRRWIRALQQLHHALPMLVFGLLARNPWHGLYDLDAFVAAAVPPLELERRSEIRLRGIPLYASSTWRSS